jgi:hypothetical protein
VYLVDSAEFFESELAPPARALFALEAVFEDVNRNGRYDAGFDVLRGMRLASRSRYAWR